MEGDAFSRSGCEEIVSTALGLTPEIDILVSNPAFSRRNEFLDYDPEIFDKTLAGTLAGGFHMSQLVARHLVERGGGGKIVFISSVHGKLPFARAVAYNAAKAGLNHLMQTVAVELVRHRINVNAIAPGWIDTPGERETLSDKTVDSGGSAIPWGRLGVPGDIGRAALFLCCDDSDYITGQVITVDGGISLRPYEANQLPTND